MLRRLLLVFSFLVGALSLHAQLLGSASENHVKASLVAADASIQPGQPVTVAVRFVHDPHWHTYWKNPGTGLPSTLEWKLPPGWTAGEIQWPAPKLLKSKAGAIIGHGYEDELLLPVTLTPPRDLAAGSSVTLNVIADWLMCEDVCIPGSANLSLALPVLAEAPKPDATWGEKVRAVIQGLPRAEAAWTLTAGRSGKAMSLTVTPAAGAAGHTPTNLHFFSDNNLAGYDLPQQVKPDGKGGFTLGLQVAPDGPQEATELTGVLVSENGWLPDGSLRGLQVAAKFNGPATLLPAGGSGGAVAGGGSAASGGASGASPSSFAGTLFFAFLGGLILNLMPCVFPVLGIKILGFVNQAGHERSKVVTHGLVFTLGVLLSFWALAGALAALRAGGDQLGWGFQLQSPAFVYALAVLMLAFAMNLSGVFEFGLSATAVGSNLQMKSGYAGSFFTGVLATVVATPCSAPLLAPVLTVALTASTLESFAIFTTMAIGLSTPYLLLSIFPQAVKLLPRPGAWMETFKQLMAFPLYGAVVYLVWVLAAQTSEEGFQGILFSLVLIAMAVWMYGRWHAPGASPGRARFAWASLVVLGTVGLWLGWPRDVSAAQVTANANSAPHVMWEPWSPDAVAKLREEGKTVYVDFTARWCFTCQTNKKVVFASDEVLKYFADNKIVALRADWTNKDPRITAELASYNRSAVPVNMVWMPGKDQPVILPEILTPGTVLNALKNG